jgi:hypothetical protein
LVEAGRVEVMKLVALQDDDGLTLFIRHEADLAFVVSFYALPIWVAFQGSF